MAIVNDSTYVEANMMLASFYLKRFVRASTFCLGVMLFWSCMSIQPVVVQQLDNFNLSLEGSKPNITADLKVHNPNKVGVKIKVFQSDVFLNDKLIGVVNLRNTVRIPSHEDASIPFILDLNSGDIMSLAFASLAGSTTNTAHAKGYIVLKKFLFKKKFDFELKQNIKF